jgi:hypothetical protein
MSNATCDCELPLAFHSLLERHAAMLPIVAGDGELAKFSKGLSTESAAAQGAAAEALREQTTVKIKSPDRVKFAQGLRAAVGGDARTRETEILTMLVNPLGRCLRQYDNAAEARFLLEPDSFLAFGKEHLPVLLILGLANIVDSELQRLGA